MEVYTYMGTADDVVRRYPWTSEWSIGSINNQLIHSVIYGQNMVINDGYIVANPELLDSLKNLQTSLLGNVLLSGAASLFCRSDPRNLAEGLLKSKEKLHTHKRALSGKNESIFIRQMETLQTYVNKTPIQWPTDKNTGAIFASFLNRLNYDDNLKLALPDSNSKRDFETIYSLFSDAMDDNFNEARQEWERLCWREFEKLNIDDYDPFSPYLKKRDSYKRIKTMMQIANEAYHVAYASAMSWSLRDRSAHSRPLTAFCPAYMDIFEKTVFYENENNVRYEGLGSLLISVDLLKFGGSANYSWIMGLVLDDEIVQVREEYLKLLDDYINWKGDLKTVRKVAEKYRKQLAETVSDHVPTYSDIAETIFNFIGGNQVVSVLQAVDSLTSKLGILSPINLDPVGWVKQIIEPGEVDVLLERPGLNSTIYGSTESLARELGLVNVNLDMGKIENILKPIKPYQPNA